MLPPSRHRVLTHPTSLLARALLLQVKDALVLLVVRALELRCIWFGTCDYARSVVNTAVVNQSSSGFIRILLLLNKRGVCVIDV